MDRRTDRPSRDPRGALGRSLARGVASTDPLGFVAASWWLALVAIAVLQVAHDGLHEHLELTPVLHLLRDGALAVPAAAIAVLVGSIAATVAIGGRGPRSPMARVTWVLVTVAVFAILSIPGNQLHGALFGAEEEEDLSFLADAALDAAIALGGGLIALIPFALVVGPPIAGWTRTPQSEPTGPMRPGPGDLVARSSK